VPVRAADAVRTAWAVGDKTATTDDNGRFVFKDVPPGKHTLNAKGAALNRFREGSAEIVTAASAEPASVVIRLE